MVKQLTKHQEGMTDRQQVGGWVVRFSEPSLFPLKLNRKF